MENNVQLYFLCWCNDVKVKRFQYSFFYMFGGFLIRKIACEARDIGF